MYTWFNAQKELPTSYMKNTKTLRVARVQAVIFALSQELTNLDRLTQYFNGACKGVHAEPPNSSKFTFYFLSTCYFILQTLCTITLLCPHLFNKLVYIEKTHITTENSSFRFSTVVEKLLGWSWGTYWEKKIMLSLSLS